MPIPSLIGIIGGFIGAISGLLALWDRWKNRKPRLYLLAPYNFSCNDAFTKRPIRLFYIRIANSSKKPAFLYIETMSIEVNSSGIWHKMEILKTDSKTPLETDFSESQKVCFGLRDMKYINRFDETVVDYDSPLCGLVPLAFQSNTIHKIEKIKMKIKDCHLNSYTMVVDLANQQRKHDPDYKPSN